MEYRIEKENRSLKAGEIKEIKRLEAAERQEAHNKLTPEQKLAKLDKKLGKGVGAKKERAKLQKEIEKNS